MTPAVVYSINQMFLSWAPNLRGRRGHIVKLKENDGWVDALQMDRMLDADMHRCMCGWIW